MFHKDKSSVVDSLGKKAKDVPVRKSDRRHVRQQAERLLSDAAAKEVLDVVFLQGNLYSRKLSLANNQQAILYFRGADKASPLWPYHRADQCVWIDLGDTQAPSVALLSICSLLPIVVVHSQVSKYLCRGAHLMRPGISRVVGNVSADTVVAVCVAGNPQPFAVGVWQESTKHVLTGVGVSIVSCYGDDLWCQQVNKEGIGTKASQAANLFDAGHYGNPGFCQGQIVVPTETNQKVKDDDGNLSNNNAASQDHEREATATSAETTGLTDSTDSMQQTENSEPISDVPVLSGESPTQVADTPIETASEPPIEPQPLTPDQILHTSVCRALSKLSKKDFPMTVATFYAQHVLHNRPQDTTIELKQTTWKKFGTYLQAQSDLVTVGPDKQKKDPVAFVTGYNPRHPDLVVLIKEAKANKADKSGKARLVLIDLYCVPSHVASLLQLDPNVVQASQATSPERQGSGCLTLKEARGILDGYIQKEELVDPHNPACVILNAPLTQVLYKNKQQTKQSSKTTAAASVPTETNALQDNTIPVDLSRKDLTNLWLSKLEIAYGLVEMPGSQIVQLGRGKGPRITVEVSRRQQRKFITRVAGMEDFGIEADRLAQDVAHRFACAASVDAEVNDMQVALKKGHAVIVLQGNLADELEALLTGNESLSSHGGAKNSEYCLPSNAIDFVMRKGVPARKRGGGSGGGASVKK
jgi:translation initiation factor 2D